uniref:Uncharacterized protein n=1 Tax=Meloidogyne enterolobii TaxID=390850 RepID=A0A6V7TZ42_MELEN|nr:unnamed protein product [Meloidogyne enterolobii]
MFGFGIKWIYEDEEYDILLELPNIIKNKNQLKIVYYYLNKLFNCSFESGYINEFVFNPNLIELLFERIPKQFRVQTSLLMPFEASISENFLKFFMKYLLSEILRINFYGWFKDF